MLMAVMKGEGDMTIERTTKKPVGRPKGEASIIVNVRLPLSLIARLDCYLDNLETQTGLKANRGMIARRAIVEFLDAHETVKGRHGKR